MVDFFNADAGTILGVLGQDQSAQKSRLAQYAILQAGQYLKDKRPDDAIRAFKQALAFEPQNVTALNYIGNINLSNNNNAEAIKAFKQLANFQLNSVDAWMSLGGAYLQDKQYDESEKTYLHAAKIDPTNPLPIYTLGLQYLNTDRLSEAENMLLESQRLAPRDGNVYYAIGQLYNKQGKYDEAVQSLTTALDLKPNFPLARYELGIAYSSLNQTDDAKAQLKILSKDAPTSIAYSDLAYALDKPKILTVGAAPQSNVNLSFGANTQLWYFDPSFLTPDTSKVISVNIQFNQNMDMASVINPMNWSISRAKGGVAGYYNNTAPVSSREANITKNPLSVSYDATTGTATVNFMLSQNAAADATIDPRHLVFQFTGKDAYGRSMDNGADQIDYAAGRSF